MPALKSVTMTQQLLNYETVPRTMTVNGPTHDVRAGDYLVLTESSTPALSSTLTTPAPSGWTRASGGSNMWYKLCNGSESGQNFTFNGSDIHGFGYGSLTNTAVVLQYRFQEVPTSILTGTGGGFNETAPPLTLNDTQTTGTTYEVRVYMTTAAATTVLSGFYDERPVDSIVWTNATEQAGLYEMYQTSTGGAGLGIDGDESYGMSVADYVYIPTSTNPAVSAVSTYSGTTHTVFGSMTVLRFRFSAPPFTEPDAVATSFSLQAQTRKVQAGELPYHISTDMYPGVK